MKPFIPAADDVMVLCFVVSSMSRVVNALFISFVLYYMDLMLYA